MDLSDQIHNFLKNISLYQLIERREIKDIASRQERGVRDRIDSLLITDSMDTSRSA